MKMAKAGLKILCQDEKVETIVGDNLPLQDNFLQKVVLALQ